MDTLKLNDCVKFEIDGKVYNNYVYKNSHDNTNYYLHLRGWVGKKIFDLINKDKNEFVRGVLGYVNSGSFPECNTLEDLTKLVNAIQEVINSRKDKYIIPVNEFRKAVQATDICPKWESLILEWFDKSLLYDDNITINKEQLDAMWDDASGMQRSLILTHFPDYTRNELTCVTDMKVGEVIRVCKTSRLLNWHNSLVMKVGDPIDGFRWVNLNNPRMVLVAGDSKYLKGTLVDVEIKKKE